MFNLLLRVFIFITAVCLSCFIGGFLGFIFDPFKLDIPLLTKVFYFCALFLVAVLQGSAIGLLAGKLILQLRSDR